MKKANKLGPCVIAGAAFAISLSAPTALLAQELEEVVVTAQRRVQSLQDVPISIETVSGDEIITQGYRNLDELAEFVPGMVMEHDVENQSLMIRGQGTNTKNLIQENGVPIFIDGVSFSRIENIRGTFLDIERMEVLRGPQPVYFGQSARAGAISVITRKPSLSWEGDVMVELGNQTEKAVELAAGGPITDTLGIRVAGRVDQSEGFLRDVITDSLFSERDFKVGRVTLEWTPTEKLQLLTKVDVSSQRSGGDTWGISPRENTATEDLDPSIPVNYYAFGIPGVGFEPVSGEAGWTRRGVTSGPLYFSPTELVTSPNGTSAAERRRGVLDLTSLTREGWSTPVPLEQISYDGGAPWGSQYRELQDGVPVPKKFQEADFTGVVENDLGNALLNVSYELDNGIEINSITAYGQSDYVTTRGLASPFLTNPRTRYVDFDMWSQELRFTSPTGGTIEWMAGLYWQLNDAVTSGNTWEASAVFGPRGSVTSEEAEWRSMFAAVTYNFLGDRASLDVGARYSDVDKKGHGINYLGMWVVEDVDNPGNLIALPRGAEMMDFRDSDGDGILNNVHPVLGDLSRYHRAKVVGRTPLLVTHELHADISNSFLDPQVVLRYRPTDDISVYAKWAQATVAGSFEAGVTGITEVEEDFVVGPETATIWEVGARGSFLNGRLNASATLFRNDVEDLQVSGLDLVANRRRTINAGELRTEGLEAGGRFLVTPNWHVNLSAAFLRSEYLLFDNAVCTSDLQERGLCDIRFDSAGVPQAVLDRTGERGPDAPRYHVVLGSTYSLSLFDNYNLDFNVQGSTRQFYVGNQTLGLDESDHRDELNLAVVLSNADDTWNLRFYGRNVLETRPALLGPDEIPDDPIVTLRTTLLSPNDFGSYGVQFRYFFR